MNTLLTEWPIIWVLGCVSLAFGYAFLLYSVRNFSDNNVTRRLLFLMRFAVVFILSFFLLKPYINYQSTTKERPIITVGVDNSTSMLSSSDSIFVAEELSKQINLLKSEFSNTHQIDLYSFGENINISSDFDFRDRKSDLSSYLNEVSNLYSNRNLTANVVITDGIFNSSYNPLYANYSLNSPLYTLAVGDTSLKEDLEITKVSYNELSFLGNTFPVEVSVLSQFCKNAEVKVGLYQNQSMIAEASQTVNSPTQLLNFKFEVEASEKGLQKYSIKVNSLESESNLLNNQQEIFLEVLESKQKILLLSDISHPDINALSSALSTNDNYDLTILSNEKFDGDYQPYNLIIAFQTEILNSTLPVFYFLGNSSPTISNEWFEISGTKSLNEVTANYTPFSLFSINDSWKSWLNQLPPLHSLNSDLQFKTEHYNLFNQTILGIETNRPIFSFVNQNGLRYGLCNAEGLWKWRLYEYMLKKEHQFFDEIINKSIQYLSSDEDNRPLKLRYDKIIDEDIPFYIEADFYNSNFELVNSSDLFINIKDDNNIEYPYTFNKSINNYKLEISDLDAGDYSFEVNLNFNGKDYKSLGQFSIRPIEIEQMNTRANHQLLYALSEKYEGQFYFVNQFEDLKQSLSTIESPTLSYTSDKQSDLLNLKWISILLFVFLSLEWILRKRKTNI